MTADIGSAAPWRARTVGQLCEEALVVGFFLWIALVCFRFTDRPTLMPDQSLTFDQWWYFYDRLRHGELAQWNPYSLLGRIAVQWDYIPAGLLFLGFLPFPPRIENMPLYGAAGMFAAYLAIYIAGRVAGYHRLLALAAPTTLIALGFYRYAASFLHIAAYLALIPLPFAVLVAGADGGKVPTRTRWIVIALLFALAFSGLRLEHVVYTGVFAGLAVAVLAVSRRPGARLRTFAAGCAAIAFGLAANAWQFAILYESLCESARLAVGTANGASSVLLLQWTALSFFYQPGMVIAGLALAGLLACRLSGIDKARAPQWLAPGALAALTIVMLLLMQLLFYATKHDFPHPPGGLAIPRLHIDALREWYGILALAVAVGGYLLVQASPTVGAICKVIAAAFVGSAVSSYSWFYVPIDQPHNFFMPPWLAASMAIGAVGLLLRGRDWILIVLAAYHILGETLAIPLWQWASVPWNLPRAALPEVAFTIVLLLESLRFFGIILVNGARKVSAPSIAIGWQVRSVGSVIWTVAAGWCFGQLALPLVAQPLMLDAALFLPADLPFTPLKGIETAFDDWTRGPDGKDQPRNFLLLQRDENKSALRHVSGSAAAHTDALSVALASGTSLALIKDLFTLGGDITPFSGRAIRFAVSARRLGDAHARLILSNDDAEFRNGKLYQPTQEWQQFVSPYFYVRPAAKLVRTSITLDTHDIDSGGTDSDSDATIELRDLRVEVSAPVALNNPRVYQASLPFGGSPAGYNFRNDWMVAAAHASADLRKASASLDPEQRVAVSDDVLRLADPVQSSYRFLPAYSGVHNTAPIYASEIPQTLFDIFKPMQGESGPSIPHSESSPFTLLFAAAEAHRSEVFANGNEYFSRLTIAPHSGSDTVAQALLAEQGTASRRAFLVGPVAVFDGLASERAALKQHLDEGGSLTDSITTSDPAFRRTNEVLSGSGSATFVEDAPEHVAIDVTTGGPSHLVLLDLFAPGWRARVNGVPRPIYRAYIGTRMVAVPAGHSLVEFHYRVPMLMPTAALSLAAWMGLTFFLMLGRRKSHEERVAK